MSSSFQPIAAEAVPEKEGLVHGVSAQELQRLGEESMAAKAKAYCPYSLFRVGAALLVHPSPSDPSPALIVGGNVENAAYPVGTCAERVAMGTAVVQGHKLGSFKAVAVAADINEFCSPCGMCRQFLREFLALDTPIFMFNNEGKYIVRTMGDLLPLSFGPDVLPPREKLRNAREGQS